MQYKDYYETLGVSKSASQDDIRKAFRKLARQYHPDVAKDKKNAESKFKEINEAYEVVGDPEKRKKYDALGKDWERGGGFPPPPRRGGRPGAGQPAGDFSFGGTGFSDFFEQFFGGRDFGGHAGGGKFTGFGMDEAARGNDVEADLLVTLEEALHGTKKKISFRRNGSPKVETYEVRIPKGVREGQRIRLAGQGEAGARRDLAGDLYLRVRFAQHPDYRIDGNDLISELEIPAWKAVLGCEMDVSTPDGNVRLKVPAGTQPGRKFRLKGRGLPTGPDTRGDFFVQLDVSLPSKLSHEERQHWEAISRIES